MFFSIHKNSFYHMYSRVDILQHLSSYNQILLEQAVSKVILANYGLVMAGVRTVKHIVV